MSFHSLGIFEVGIIPFLFGDESLVRALLMSRLVLATSSFISFVRFVESVSHSRNAFSSLKYGGKNSCVSMISALLHVVGGACLSFLVRYTSERTY
jgi:hypothetical protein